ncbi:hypothetical protein BTM25_27800 [Actinomadura rubteroloni]|uniref:Peptidase MA-like domain-containing protein n=1 Tax=Actinomadura rubteroloni TaxID=1926885 RepID=A0A2P4UGG5_9ACTN|nr:hypothetical protein [Actinomadura rubteroloni]POM24153.1 hypothetical protein BTM25_27800 [Actinomadura rubteroloni]
MTDDPGDGAPRPASARRRIALGAGLCVVLCLLAAYAFAARGHDRPAPVAAPSPAAARAPRPADVRTVLANRAAAVRAGDRARFLATVASAPAAFRDAQGRVFDNLRRLPLATWGEHYESADGTTVAVAVRYRFAGYDRADVVRERHLTFASRSGAWTITGSGAGDAPEIWDGGPLTVVRGASSLVVGDAAGLDQIAGLLDRAVPAVTAVTGRDWARRVVALAPAQPAVAAALAGDDQDLGQIAALATVAPGADGSPGDDRVLIAPGTFARLNPLGRRVVLTHELTHVATGGAHDGRTPLWLIEGFADYVGYRDAKVSVRAAAGELAADVRAGRVPGSLPSRAAFGSGSADLAQSYQEAWLACRMIAERYGEATLVRLYRAAGRRDEGAALRDVLGTSRAGFTAAWRDYLRKELR